MVAVEFVLKYWVVVAVVVGFIIYLWSARIAAAGHVYHLLAFSYPIRFPQVQVYPLRSWRWSEVSQEWQESGPSSCPEGVSSPAPAGFVFALCAAGSFYLLSRLVRRGLAARLPIAAALDMPDRLVVWVFSWTGTGLVVLAALFVLFEAVKMYRIDKDHASRCFGKREGAARKPYLRSALLHWIAMLSIELLVIWGPYIALAWEVA